ncbi:MAG: alpha/beta hydrolase [Bacteroidetes bacterium]|nr:alpha/beta hydrolase [Bacteroidota bacterium]
MANREIAALKAHLAAHAPPPGATLAESRAATAKRRAMKPRPGLTVERVMLGGVPADRLAFADSAADRVVLHHHGGGYIQGTAETHRAYGAELAWATRGTVYMSDYRLAPEHPFPAAFDDAVAAYRGLLDLGIAPDKLALAGDSAGGGLALASAMEARARRWPQPAALALLSPWIDLACTSESWQTLAAVDPGTRDILIKMTTLYAGTTSPVDWRMSPLHGDLSGLPPMLILAGTDEGFVGEAVALYGKAKAAGRDASLDIWPDMIHVWPTWPDHLVAAKQAIGRIADFLRDRLPPR